MTAPPLHDNAAMVPLDTELGNITQQIKRGLFAQAEQQLRQILVEHPDAPSAHRMLATLALNTRRPELAIEHMRTVCELMPNAGSPRCEFGCLLAHIGQLDAALEQFELACSLTPDAPDAWYFLGITLMRVGRDTQALAPLNKALALGRSDIKTLRALASAEFEAGYPDDALPLWQQLHALQRDDVDAILKLGETLSRLGNNAEADTVYKDALARLPNSAEIWMAHAQTQEDLGHRDLAAQSYEHALMLRPGWAFPLSGLLGLRRGSAPESHVQEALKRQSDPALSDPERALIGYELGKVYDNRGEYQRAMDSWDDANAARRRMIGEFDAAPFLSVGDAIIETFDGKTIKQWHNGSRDERPIFIVGMPRSGTTLTEQIIAAHSRAFGCGELPDMALIAKHMTSVSAQSNQWPHACRQLDDAAKQVAIDRYLRAATRHAPKSALRLVDKAPMNFRLLGLIAQLFPKARVIWCRRDPRDIAVSIYGENFSLREKFAASLSGIGHCINMQEKLMRHWQSVLPIPILELDYQQLASSIEVESRRLITFVGLDWEPACLDFHTGERSVQTPSRWQVRQPVHTRSIGRWKNYSFALDPLLDVLKSPV